MVTAPSTTSQDPSWHPQCRHQQCIGHDLNAAQMALAAAAAASACDKESSETLHYVYLSTQLRVCPSHGLWDLLDISKFEDPAIAVFQCKSFTVIELKHGRVYTLACNECFVHEYFNGQLLSPSEELTGRFFPISSEATEQRLWLTHCAVLAADSIVLESTLLIGWAQIVAICGMTDFFIIQAEPIQYLGDYELFGTFGMIDAGSIGPSNLMCLTVQGLVPTVGTHTKEFAFLGTHGLYQWACGAGGGFVAARSNARYVPFFVYVMDGP